MSYQVLARKWRPRQFSDVVGQSHVLTALENALEHNRLHHAYLFSGTRGVGKTTIARIFAKGLNCEQGITANPCGQCATCKEIDEGRFVDLLEIDAASRTKVEDTRDLLDNVQYKPARGRFKIYIIDEVHMLSRHSFNALLKTLEEPPEYVKFLLATTDPQKLPVTILSRCLQFHLKHLSTDQIQHQLDHVLHSEGVTSEPRALQLLAKAAEGSMRDALSLTDQAIALGNGEIFTAQVADMLGTLADDQAISLLEALTHADAALLLHTLGEIASVGVDWDGLLKELATQLHRIAMFQVMPSVVAASHPDHERISVLAATMSPQDVQLYYQIALQGRDDLNYAPDGRAGLEMTLLRMLAFQPAKAMWTPQPVTAQTVSVQTPGNTNAPVRAASPSPVTAKPAPQESTEQPARAAVKQAQAEPVVAPVRAPQDLRAVPHATPAQPEMPPPADLDSMPPLPDEQDDYHDMVPHHDTAPSAVPQTQQANQEQVSAQPATSSTAGHLLAAGNLLRSRAKAKQQGDNGPKKVKPVSAGKTLSALERIAAEHPAEPGLPQPKPDNAKPSEPEDYRWKPTGILKPKAEVVEITPETIKTALNHTKTPEMAAKLLEESCTGDEWSRIANQLDVGRLVKQLALNAAMEQSGESVTLVLRPDQSHLQSDKAQQQLEASLSTVMNQPVHLTIRTGTEGTTPLELREQLYSQKLAGAIENINNDPNIQFICQRFAARVDEDSIRPL
ncbi:DNA polymerase III subunit gamma/tau [Parasalinivibrio latis]|uniref:DNA polymerase III subunit gamma/tau n=1 Tax=Parasalinivibrio latis TaxID=2952610 RepID=UPI0030DE5EFE